MRFTKLGSDIPYFMEDQSRLEKNVTKYHFQKLTTQKILQLILRINK